MAIVNNDIIRLAVVWDLDGSDEQINTYHVRVQSPPASLVDLYADITDYLEDLYAEVRQNSPNELVHNRVEIYNVTGDNPELPIGALVLLNGTSTAERMAEGVAPLVFARTSVKRRIGRKFLPVATEENLDSGVWASTAFSRMQIFAGKWASIFTAPNGTVFEALVGSSLAMGFSVIAQAVASPRPGYQRRRRIGRGS